MRTIDQVVADFRREAMGDYVGLWEIVSATIRDLDACSDVDIRRTTISIVKELLSQGLQAVDLTERGGCTPWHDQNADAVIVRICREWDSLGKAPDIGDIVWFDLPDSGLGSEREVE